ncbi:MAG: hypothetical protein GY854_00510 [Deltaproteobacteria bacterium]|nr:hypothetical protein [Deltaproteobacteria bacterium]
MRRIVISITVLSLLIFGCQDPLHEYKECKEIENARCELRKDCYKAGNAEFRKEYKGFDYDTCIAYAREHCRTRKIGGGEDEVAEAKSDWNNSDVDDCVEAIGTICPDQCKDLDKSIDETESNKFPAVAEVCWFINKDDDEDEEEEEPEDAGTDSAPPDTDDDPPSDAGADGS